jgi:hypothetical protein
VPDVAVRSLLYLLAKTSMLTLRNSQKSAQFLMSFRRNRYAGDPFEQMILELINLVRLDLAAEAAREGSQATETTSWTRYGNRRCMSAAF